MKKYQLLLATILLLAFTLRIHHYADFPQAGTTKDELAWTWHGSSLLQGKLPQTWSWMKGYTHTQPLTLADWEFVIVTPYLDNPPLFAFIPGVMALIKGVRAIQLPPITAIRFPMLFIGTLNVFLLYQVACQWSSKKLALLAAVFYTTYPTAVFTSRLVVAENLLISWMLLAMLLLHSQTLNHKLSRQTFLLGLICGLAVLTKVAGLIISIAIIAFLINHKHYSQAKIVALITLTVSSLWLIYAALIDWDLFLTIQTTQGSRNIGWSTLLFFFFRPIFVAKSFIDGWTTFGLIILISQFFTSSNKQLDKLIKTFTLSWFIFFLATLDQTNINGWYRYPLYPLAAILIAKLITAIWEQRNMLGLVILNCLCILPSLRLLLFSRQIALSPLLVRLGLLIALTPIISPLVLKPQKQRWLIIAVFILALGINIALITSFSHQYLSIDDLYFFPPRNSI